MEDQQHFSLPQCSNPAGASKILNNTEIEHLNHQIQNRIINAISSDGDDTQNVPISQIPPVSEEIHSDERVQVNNNVTQMIYIIEGECAFMKGLLLNNLAYKNVIRVKSDEQFALKVAELDRIGLICQILQEIIHRCRRLEIYRLNYILNGKKSYSTINRESIQRTVSFLQRNFQSRQSLYQLTKEINTFEEHSDKFTFKLAKAKARRKRRLKGKHKRELPSPKSLQNIVTPIDKQIASTLTILLNSTEYILLPMLREARILPESNTPRMPYYCKDTPLSIITHVVIFEAILSESEGDWNYNQILISELDDFLKEAKLWIDDSISRHKNLRPLYLDFHYNLRVLNIPTLYVTLEEYEDLVNQVEDIRNQYAAVKNLILASISVDRFRLEEVSRSMFYFRDAVDMIDVFAAMMKVFYWLPTVSGKYEELIKKDEDYMTTLKEKLLKLKILNEKYDI